MAKLSILISILAIITTVHAAAVNLNKRDSTTVTIDSVTVFCSMLPRDKGQFIGDSEDTAVSFCTQQTPNASGARLFPENFIKCHFYDSGDGYVQITGSIDNTIYVNSTDQGGQYDTNAPGGSNCFGFAKYVNLVEPNVDGSSTGHFCIRCCDDDHKDMCPTGRSGEGCESIIGGQYDC